ncbi:MAG: PIN domain-containing protein [Candidatus Micrarchaeota archaeon]
MHLIVDTNIIISALIRRAITYEIIKIGNLHIYVPEHSIQEIERNKQEIIDKMKVSADEFQIVLISLLSHVEIIPRGQYCEFEEQAKQVCPHYKDFTFFALALAKDLPLWTNEKRLAQQSRVTVYNTGQIIEKIGRNLFVRLNL